MYLDGDGDLNRLATLLRETVAVYLDRSNLPLVQNNVKRVEPFLHVTFLRFGDW